MSESRTGHLVDATGPSMSLSVLKADHHAIGILVRPSGRTWISLKERRGS